MIASSDIIDFHFGYFNFADYKEHSIIVACVLYPLLPNLVCTLYIFFEHPKYILWQENMQKEWCRLCYFSINFLSWIEFFKGKSSSFFLSSFSLNLILRNHHIYRHGDGWSTATSKLKVMLSSKDPLPGFLERLRCLIAVKATDIVCMEANFCPAL